MTCGWAPDILGTNGGEHERKASRVVPKALSLRSREKGVALFQDGEA